MTQGHDLVGVRNDTSLAPTSGPRSPPSSRQWRVRGAVHIILFSWGCGGVLSTRSCDAPTPTDECSVAATSTHETLFASVPRDASGLPIGVPPNFHMRFMQSACDGTCPEFWIHLDGEGELSFLGVLFTKTHGRVRTQIDAETTLEVVRALDAAHFGSFREDYISEFCAGIRGSPYGLLKVRFGGASREVSMVYDCEFCGQPELYALFTSINKILNTRQWVGFCQDTDCDVSESGLFEY